MGEKYDDAFYDALSSVGYAKDGLGRWWCRPLRQSGQVPLEGQHGGPVWAVTENADSTITVAPSINIVGTDGWHGFITDGKWVPA